MPNLSITAANVGVGGQTAKLYSVPLQAGENLTQGQPAYQKSTDRKWYRTDANLSLEASGSGVPVVIVLTPASTDGYFIGVESGPYIVGATLTQGVTYAVSDGVGLIRPLDELPSGSWVTVLGTASSSTVLRLAINATGIQKP